MSRVITPDDFLRLERENESLKRENEALKAKIATLEGQPEEAPPFFNEPEDDEANDE